MADEPEEVGWVRPISAAYYSVYDMDDSSNPLFYFSSMTGGDQKISTVPYNVDDGRGNITTKYIPGQTSFDPVSLLGPMTLFSKPPKDSFWDSVNGKLAKVRKNYSIYLHDETGKAMVWWHLMNAIPVSIGGFSFNASKEANYTDFEFTLQPEWIYIQFEPFSDDPFPA